MSIHIFDAPDSKLKIKSFSSATKSEKVVIRIELETDLEWLGYTLRELAQTQKAQRQRPKQEPKPKPTKAKVLALPAPQLALPSPEDKRK